MIRISFFLRVPQTIDIVIVDILESNGFLLRRDRSTKLQGYFFVGQAILDTILIKILSIEDVHRIIRKNWECTIEAQPRIHCAVRRKKKRNKEEE